MLNILKDKRIYTGIILSALPLTAVCTTAISALIAAVISLISVLSTGLVISALKKFITDKTAPFAQLVISAGFVGILSAVFSLFAQKQIGALGIYIPLITLSTSLLLNCDYTLNNGIKKTALQGAVTVGASSLIIILCGILREFLGLGALFSIDIYTKHITPITFFTTPAGGLLTLALLSVAYALIIGKEDK